MIRRSVISELEYIETYDGVVFPEGINISAPFEMYRSTCSLEVVFRQEYELAGYLYLYPNGMVDTQ